jgi:hypothetical protein
VLHYSLSQCKITITSTFSKFTWMMRRFTSILALGLLLLIIAVNDIWIDRRSLAQIDYTLFFPIVFRTEIKLVIPARTPTPTLTRTPTLTSTPFRSVTPIPTSTITPTNTQSPTPTYTPTRTPTTTLAPLPSFTMIFITSPPTITQTSTWIPTGIPLETDNSNFLSGIDKADWGIIVLVGLVWMLLGTWLVLMFRQK